MNKFELRTEGGAPVFMTAEISEQQADRLRVAYMLDMASRKPNAEGVLPPPSLLCFSAEAARVAGEVVPGLALTSGGAFSVETGGQAPRLNWQPVRA
jgi:hypothetical protein